MRLLAISVALLGAGGCEAIDDFSPFHVVWLDGGGGDGSVADGRTGNDGAIPGRDLGGEMDSKPSADASPFADLGLGDMTTGPPIYTLRGSTSGLGAGRSTGGAFALIGSIGIPQPRVASSGGTFTLLPIIP